MIPDFPHNIRIRLAQLKTKTAKLRQPTGQRQSNVRMQQNNFLIGPILFLYYEESLASSNLNYLGFILLILMYIQTFFFQKFDCIIISLKTDELGINSPISWTSRTQNISKNLNIYPHESRITLFTFLWDTLYKKGHFEEIGATLQILQIVGNSTLFYPGPPRLLRPPRPGPCLNFGFQYALIRSNQSKKFGVEYWALPGSNLPWGLSIIWHPWQPWVRPLIEMGNC
jgi:hypothetical protein